MRCNAVNGPFGTVLGRPGLDGGDLGVKRAGPIARSMQLRPLFLVTLGVTSRQGERTASSPHFAVATQWQDLIRLDPTSPSRCRWDLCRSRRGAPQPFRDGRGRKGASGYWQRSSAVRPTSPEMSTSHHHETGEFALVSKGRDTVTLRS